MTETGLVAPKGSKSQNECATEWILQQSQFSSYNILSWNLYFFRVRKLFQKLPF